jgi:MFS family permease
VGSVLAAVSIYLLFPLNGWSLCFIVAVFPAVFMLWAARYLKESPQFAARHRAEMLLEQGRTEAAHGLAESAGVST